ncbi:MAG: HD domain-containing protein [Thermoplasmata archaeon HGW-Thermoplasmata-1]|nr:MAG: HD domain-containing protein [Thermoplasmata archaeon HGW-Thermoplasmata-1]
MDHPDPEECRGIMQRAGCRDAVISHVETVRVFAMVMAKRIAERGLAVDMTLVEAGALLHDIGRAMTHGIKHAVEGAAMARALGLPDALVSIIEKHIGAGLTASDAKALGLPVKDYMPETLEEKIVAHADNLTAGHSRQTLRELVGGFEKKGLFDSAKRVVSLHGELSELCGEDVDELLYNAGF